MRDLKFGVIIKALRTRKGWSQEELAEKVHMSRSAISKLENDQQTLDVPTLMRMIQATNAPEVAVSILYGMDGITILQNIMTAF
ncbi:helix-turn-helix domain-containing protein [Paenibacillus melissococcoides]|uniref:helix-turn-helix domain-containing protein n=1 Tax=Paenibacillus TaxID=44249 RepID=UPI0020C0A285|nr:MULTISPECIES: helix-turn-helix transcriptional regulator [Paenibacillus]MEB9892855.1 helix-turn-helix transcriptional regulator [Bacillus cereus]CAH8719511.1 helix-turn-helix domain-containing protein [Paenibacillus melissococcoides]CAH8720518.1 helix-turn-helix domain-containing protein [Paenibacillus melissococcoides]